MIDEAEAFAKLAELTGQPVGKWREILSLPPAAQAVVLRDYADCDWTVPGDKLQAVLAAVGVIAQIAGYAIPGVNLAAAITKL